MTLKGTQMVKERGGYTTLQAGLEEDFAWLTGMHLHGLTFKRKTDTWLLVVRAQSAHGRAKVAFVETGTPEECLELLWSLIGGRGMINWRDDQYKSTMGSTSK